MTETLADKSAPARSGLSARRSAPGRTVESARPTPRRLPRGVGFFLLSMVTPFILYAGGLRLSPYRIVLLIWFLPLLVGLLAGRAGRIRMPDILFFLLCVWTGLAIAVNHGLNAAVEPTGIFVVETFGAYLLGRVLIRDAANFRAMAYLWFCTVLILVPVALMEASLGRNVLLEAFDAVGRTYREANMDPRLGLNRAQGSFQHPILFGVYCGGAISLTFFVVGYGREAFSKFWRTATVLGSAMTCLSSGPLTAMVGQMGMISWNRMFRSIPWRWWLLAGLAVFAWVFVDVFSNRTPPQVFISYFALNERTAYNRVLIWRFGSDSVLANPLFGVGFGEWARPSWMSGSMDMFWLVGAVRYGLPAGLLMLGGFLWVFLKVTFKKGLNDEQRAYRLGFISSMVGFFLVGWTVHFWNETYVMLLFLVGSGVWFLDAQAEPNGAQGSAHPENAARRSFGSPPPAEGLTAPRPSQETRDQDEESLYRRWPVTPRTKR